MKNKLTFDSVITLTSSFIGSIYLFSITFNIFNYVYTNKYPIPFSYKIINGFTMIFSGILFICCCNKTYMLL